MLILKAQTKKSKSRKLVFAIPDYWVVTRIVDGVEKTKEELDLNRLVFHAEAVNSDAVLCLFSSEDDLKCLAPKKKLLLQSHCNPNLKHEEIEVYNKEAQEWNEKIDQLLGE